MAIDVSQLTIKVISDGIDKATNSLNRLAEASAKVESSTVLVKAKTEESSVATSNASKTTTSYIDRLQTRVDLLGKNNAYSAAYTATQKKLSEENIALAKSLGGQIDSYKMQVLTAKQAEAAEKALQAAQEKGNALNLAGQRAAQWKALSAAQSEAIKMDKEYNLLAKAQEEALSINNAMDQSAARYKEIATAANARMQAQQAEIAAQRVATDEVARATGYSGELTKAQNALMASSTKVVDVNNSVSAAFARSNGAMKQQVRGIDDILASISPAEKGLQRLAADEEDLRIAFQKGRASAADLAEGEALIAAKRAALVERQAKTIAKATEDASKGAAGLLTNAGAMREFFVILREGARGDFSRLAGSVSLLVDRLGYMGIALAVLTSPITWFVAALGAIGIAAVVGADEANNFNKALILTGNYAGETASQMEKAAAQLKNIDGQHAAAKALTEVANTGRFAGQQVEMVGEAALRMEQMTGQSVEATIKQFEELGKSPADAVYKLDQQYHFLTADVYEQIRALDEQGKHQEASDLAMKTYADTINSRSPQILENLGYFEKAWRTIKEEVIGAANAAMNFGRTSSLQQQKKDLEVKLSFAGDYSVFGSDTKNDIRAKIEAINEQIRMANRAASDSAENTLLQSKGKEALKAVDDHLLKMKSELRLQQQINEITQQYIDLKKAEQNSPSKAYEDKLAGVKFNADGVPVSGGLFQQEIEDAKRKNKIAKPRTNEYSIDASLQKNKNAIQDLVDTTASQMKQYKAEYDRGETDTETYLQKDYQAKMAAYQKELDLAQDNLEISKQKKNISATEMAQKEIKKLEDKALADTQQYHDSMDTLDKKRQDSVQKLTDSLVATYQARQEEISNAIGGAGLGAAEQDALARQLQAQRAFNTEMKRLNADLLRGEQHGGINKTTYDQETAALKNNLDKRLAQERQYTADKIKIQGDWSVGASKAFQDYEDNANNVASSVQSAFTDGFKGMEDALTTFITTGKLSFGSLVNTILADMARIEAKKFMSSLMGGSGGTAGGIFGTMIAGLGAGYGSFATMNAGVAASNGLSIADLAGAFADGGDPPVNQMSLVGEKGPELFVPKQAGTIIPNDKLGGGGATSITYAPVIHIDSRADRAQVMQDVQNAVKAGNAQLVDDLKRRRVIR